MLVFGCCLRGGFEIKVFWLLRDDVDVWVVCFLIYVCSFWCFGLGERVLWFWFNFLFIWFWFWDVLGERSLVYFIVLVDLCSFWFESVGSVGCCLRVVGVL